MSFELTENKDRPRIAAILQARLGSKRLPRKVLAKLKNTPMIQLVIERVKESRKIDDIILATTTCAEDNVLESIGLSLGIKVCRGSVDDVLTRYVQASTHTRADIFVRITCDCPLIDSKMIDDMLEAYLNSSVDYLSNCFPPTFPDGLDIEIFNRKSLEEANQNCNELKLREHVTPWMRATSSISTLTYKNKTDLSKLRWTIDEQIDLKVMRDVLEKVSDITKVGWEEIYNIYKESPELFTPNMNIQRNEGFHRSKGEKLWSRAQSNTWWK